MFQCWNSGFINRFAKFFTALGLSGGGIVDSFADAQPLQIVAAVTVDGCVAAGYVVQTFFASANRTISEIFRQIAIAAFFTLKGTVFKAF